jgi:hypothetical protein
MENPANLVEQMKSTDHLYTQLEERMRSVKATAGVSGRVWIHGTDVIAEILASGKVWGGTAALKIIGTDEDQRSAVAAEGQKQHFFVAITEDDGVPPQPGNAFTKGRQAADSKIRSNTPPPSWVHAGRPLMGIIEFKADPTKEYKLGEVKAVPTVYDEKLKRSTLPLAELQPVGIRMISEGDVVRMLDYIHATDKTRLQALPPVIRVLAKTDWQGGDTSVCRAMLGDSGDYKRLVAEADPNAWRVYDTETVIRALGYVE